MFLTMTYKKGFIHSDSNGRVKATLAYTEHGIAHCLHTVCKSDVSAKRWISSKMAAAGLTE